MNRYDLAKRSLWTVSGSVRMRRAVDGQYRIFIKPETTAAGLSAANEQ